MVSMEVANRSGGAMTVSNELNPISTSIASSSEEPCFNRYLGLNLNEDMQFFL